MPPQTPHYLLETPTAKQVFLTGHDAQIESTIGLTATSSSYLSKNKLFSSPKHDD